MAGTTHKVTSKVEMITPAMAIEMLERNVTNRNFNRHHVQSLAGAIERGEWHLNGQSISFDTNGDLQDGQHRLAAIVKANKTVPVLVVRGVDPEARPTVDVGRKRTVADELAMHGEKDPNVLGSMLTMIRRLDEGAGRGANVVLTSLQALAMLDKDASFREAAREAERLRHFVPLPASVLGYCTYHFNKLSTSNTANFWEPFQTGSFTGSNDPRFVLQRTLNKLAADRTFAKGQWSSKVYQTALVIRAWNAWRRGKTLTHFRIAKNDAFPRPV